MAKSKRFYKVLLLWSVPFADTIFKFEMSQVNDLNFISNFLYSEIYTWTEQFWAGIELISSESCFVHEFQSFSLSFVPTQSV